MAGPGRRSNVYLLELGGEDDEFAACEAASAATGVRPIAPASPSRAASSPNASAGWRTPTGRANSDGPTPTSRARRRYSRPPRSIARTVAVRATDVHGSTGIDTARAERELGQVLVDRGFSVDLEAGSPVACRLLGGRLEQSDPPTDDGNGDTEDERLSVCALGWLAAESVRDFGSRAPTDKPFFQPGSMDPLLARAVANVAGARAGNTILDPMCGTGGVLVEAGLVGADVIGTDAQRKMVDGSRENLAQFLEGTRSRRRASIAVAGLSPAATRPGSHSRRRGRRGRLRRTLRPPVEDRAPPPRGSGLRRARRSSPVAPRAVVVADRSWTEAARDAGWELESTFERRVHRSLTRYVMVLESPHQSV